MHLEGRQRRDQGQTHRLKAQEEVVARLRTEQQAPLAVAVLVRVPVVDLEVRQGLLASGGHWVPEKVLRLESGCHSGRAREQ